MISLSLAYYCMTAAWEILWTDPTRHQRKMGHICVYSVCFPWQWEMKCIAYSLHGCLSLLLEQGYNITAQITRSSVPKNVKPSFNLLLLHSPLPPPWNMKLGNKLMLKVEIFSSLLQVRYWILDKKYSYSCLFVYIAVSYDEVWVVFWKWFTCNHISPHCCPALDTISEVTGKIHNW